MAQFKTSEYPAKTVFNNGDLYDVSTYDGISAYTSEKLTFAQLKAELNSVLNFVSDNLYNADGTLTSDRTVTMDSNYLHLSGGDLGINTIPSNGSDLQVNLDFTVGNVTNTNGFTGVIRSGTSNGLILVNGDNAATNTNRRIYLRNDGTNGSSILFYNASTGGIDILISNSSGNVQELNAGAKDIDFRYRGTIESNLLKIDAGLNKVGIGVASPSEKLHVNGNAQVDGRLLVTHDNYNYNNTNIVSYVANNRGNVLEFLDGGGLNLNNYNNQLGANVGAQNFNSYFVDYNFSSTKNATDTNGRNYLYLEQNGTNSQPFTRVGINGQNTTTNELLQITLDRFGPVQQAEPIVININDQYGAHDIDLAGVDKVKTGAKFSLTNSFTSTTTGKGIVRSLWLNAQGGDENQAIYIENGLMVAPNLPTSSAGLPTGAIWNNSGVLNIV